MNTCAIDNKTELGNLQKRYDAVLRDLKSIEDYIDDPSIPDFKREAKVTEFLKLSKKLNEILEAIKLSGYMPSDTEKLGGFKK